MLKDKDIVFLWSPDKGDTFLLNLEKGSKIDTRLGVIKHDDIIGRSYGEEVRTHLGSIFYVLRPNMLEFSRRIKRKTQIIYPKEIGMIIVSLGIGPGSTVVECGTGSGSLTAALAHFVGDEGRVYTYDKREELSRLARRNCEKWNVAHRVEFKVKDIAEGFDERNVDALFLDVPNPWDYLKHAKESLAGGSRLGILVPTTNQIEKTLEGLRENGYVDVQVMELLMRYYKINAQRIRPEDMMIGHTGYLIFASTVRGVT